MNLASKPGEDVAERGRVLLVHAASAEAERVALEVREHTISISGLAIPYCALV